MIDWEDFDWRKVVGAIILAILVIIGALFVVQDYVGAERAKTRLEAQFNALNEFEAKFSPPGQAELAAMSAKIEELQKQIDKLNPKLEDAVDVAVIESKIKSLAAGTNVTIEDLAFKDEASENFLKVYPVHLVVTGTNENLSKFMGALADLKTPWRRQGEPSSSVGRLEMNIAFLAFDQQEWDKSYSCALGVKAPERADVNINKIRIFKDRVTGIWDQVESMQQKLGNATKSLNDQCALERQIAGMERRIKRSQELAQ